MNLKNYTSNVPAMTTIAYIESYLTGSGLVTGISKEIKNGRPVSIFFHTEQTFYDRLKGGGFRQIAQKSTASES